MARYGLPKEVVFCKECVLSNQKVTPSVVTSDQNNSRKNTLEFKNGVCSACRLNKEKQSSINWKERSDKLQEICAQHRSKNGGWDCIVPGSGGKDSVFQSIILREKYGMNPLTVTWAPHMYTGYGWKNFDSWLKKGGFSNFLFTPDGNKHAKLTRLAFKNLLHPFQPFIFGQRNYVMHMAKKLGINLIFFGESPAEYGGFPGEENEFQMNKMYYVDNNRDEMLISGLTLKSLKDKYDISETDLEYYLPLSSERIADANLMPMWLGYFEKFHPQKNYYFAKERVGFISNDQRTEGTYSRYNSLDDKIDGFHYWTGYIKFGVGRTSHEASQEIRNGDLERDEAVSLVHKYDGEFPARYAEEFAQYIGLSVPEIKSHADKFRPDHLWDYINGEWILKHKVI